MDFFWWGKYQENFSFVGGNGNLFDGIRKVCYYIFTQPSTDNFATGIGRTVALFY